MTKIINCCFSQGSNVFFKIIFLSFTLCKKGLNSSSMNIANVLWNPDFLKWIALMMECDFCSQSQFYLWIFVLPASFARGTARICLSYLPVYLQNLAQSLAWWVPKIICWVNSWINESSRGKEFCPTT